MLGKMGKLDSQLYHLKVSQYFKIVCYVNCVVNFFYDMCFDFRILNSSLFTQSKALMQSINKKMSFKSIISTFS
jgi:hypothetical protein